MVALSAVCLIAALAAPTAGAAGKHASKAATAAKKSSAAKKSGLQRVQARSAQSARRLRRTVRTINRRSLSNRRNIRRLRTNLTAAATELRGLITAGDTAIDNKINTIVATVTPILGQLGTGLLDLKAALEGPIAQAFTDIEAGFAEVEAGFGEVEAALTDIGDFLGGTEYGFGQVTIGANAQGGSFVVTPNVPDDVQQAQTHQRFVAQHAGDLNVLYGVRSNENDGTGASNPAAHCKVQVTNEDSSETAATAPNVDLGGVQFQPVNDKSAVTSTAPANVGFPFGLKTDAVGPPAGEEDKTTTLATTVTVAVGDVYFVDMSCVDITADPDDPEA